MSGWNDSILRVMLDKLSKRQIIDLLVSMINSFCGDDKEDLKRITQVIVCYGQCTDIVAGGSRLEDYEESHRGELFAELLSDILQKKLDDKVVSVFYANYVDSKLEFEAWKKTLLTR